MAGTPNIQTMLSIGGTMLPSFAGAIRNSKLGLIALQAQANRTNVALTGIGKGLLGFAGSFLAFESIKSFLSESIKLSKEEAGTTAALTALITNQNRLRGIGVEVSHKQVEAIERQAKALQEMSGIYKGVFLKDAEQLKMYRMSTAHVKELLPALADLTAFQKQAGIDSAGNADAIGKFAISGMGKGLRAIGIELTQAQAKLAQHLTMAQRIQMVYREIERQHPGAAAARGKTLGGQAELAKSHWTETMATIGDSFRPVQQKLTIFFGEIATIIGPPLIKLSQFISQNFDSWTKIMRDSVIPQIRSLVMQGWDFLSKGITFFKNNSRWLLPWIGEAIKWIAAWTFIIGPLIAVIKDLRLALIALQLASPWGIIAVAAGLSAIAVIEHWTEVKHFFAHFWESIVGTKNFNSMLEPKGVLRAFKKGQTPKAEPVEQGWLGWFKNFNGKKFDAQVEGWLNGLKAKFGAWLEGIGQSWDAAVLKWVQDAARSMGQWLEKMGIAFNDAAVKWWSPMQDGIMGVGQAILKWLISPITNLNDAWQKFLDSIHGEQNRNGYESGGGEGRSRGAGGGWGGNSGTPSGINWSPNGLPSLPFQADTSGARTLNARFNNPGALGPTKSALAYGGTPSGHFDTGHPFMKFATKELGAAAQFSMWWNGAYRNQTLRQAIKNWVGVGETGEDVAMSKATGIPLDAIISGDLLKSAQGIRLMQAQAKYEGQNVLSPEQWKGGQDTWKRRQFGTDAPPVIINNHTEYHIHGDTDHRQISTLHHKHIEKLKTDLQEAMHGVQRSRFA